MVGPSPFEMAVLPTHTVVLVVGGIVMILPLPRGPRSGLGMTLMAPAMTALVVWPRLQQPGEWVAAATYAAGLVVALWLLVITAHARMGGAKDE